MVSGSNNHDSSNSNSNNHDSIVYLSSTAIKEDQKYESLLPPTTEGEYKLLKASIMEYGVQIPLIISSNNNMLLDGYARLKIAKELQFDTVPCIIKHFKDDIAEMEFRMMVNIHRKRFANTAQKVKIILSLEDIEEEKNKRRELILQRVRSLHPTDFEYLVAVILKKLGYKDVKVIGGSGDNCIDILARDENDKGVAVQCKKYTTKKVTARDIQTFLGMMLLEQHVYKGIYITTSRFTRGVYKLSEKYYNTLILIDGYKLADILKEIHIDY